MQVINSRPCRAYAAAQILTGYSTSDPSLLAVKYSYPRKDGRPARTSPEAHGDILLELLEAALLDGVVTSKAVATILSRVL